MTKPRGFGGLRCSTAEVTRGLQGGATSQSQAGPAHAVGEEGSLLLTLYCLFREHRGGGLPWLDPARREVHSSSVAFESHQANGQTPKHKILSAPSALPALCCPKTLVGEEKTKQQEKILLQQLAGDGAKKPSLCKRSRRRPRGAHSLLEILPGDISGDMRFVSPQEMCY